MMRTHVTQLSSDQDQVTHMKLQQIKTRRKNAIVAIGLYLALVLVIVGYRYYDTKDIVQDGRFYRAIKQFQAQDISHSIVNKQGTRAVTKQQLGTMSWTVLHMATGAFPGEFDQRLKQKFIAFLILFGQLYPCKQCGQLFLKFLKQVQPPTGNNKNDMMVYLCKIHNKVNQHLGEPKHSCSKVKEEWNTCGCSEN